MTTLIGHKININTLSTLFGSRARVAVLKAFILDPYRSYYQRQLEAVTGLPIRAVQRELERLTEIGLFYRRVEGNRTYYQVDMDFPLFSELRAILLKIVTPLESFRGALALEESVRLAFLSGERDSALIVTSPGHKPSLPLPEFIPVEIVSSEAFLRALSEKQSKLAPYLARGVDILGRREDVIWRHIEAAGYAVPKGEGVP
jgi:DNA-binding transcriptional ArsR family regulator